MYLKTLIITALSFSAICNASMHESEKHVNKSVSISLAEVSFRTNGMFLTKDPSNEIRISYLANEGDDYIAFYRIDYICGTCKTTYPQNPGVCEICGSTDIREREIDLWPTG